MFDGADWVQGGSEHRAHEWQKDVCSNSVLTINVVVELSALALCLQVTGYL